MLKSRKEFVEIYKKLELLTEEYNKKVLFVIFKNKQIFKELLEDIIKKESEIITEEYRNFEKQRRNLLLTYCERDKENEPVIENEQFIIKQEFQNKFSETIKHLFEEYKDTIEKYENNKKQFEEYINEKIELELGKYSFNDLPENMNVEKYSLMSLFIKETEEEISKLV